MSWDTSTQPSRCHASWESGKIRMCLRRFGRLRDSKRTNIRPAGACTRVSGDSVSLDGVLLTKVFQPVSGSHQRHRWLPCHALLTNTRITQTRALAPSGTSGCLSRFGPSTAHSIHSAPSFLLFSLR